MHRKLYSLLPPPGPISNKKGQLVFASLQWLVFVALASLLSNGSFGLLAILLALATWGITVTTWNWFSMMAAYQLSFRYRRVLPFGNRWHRFVHAFLEEAVSGSRLTDFLGVFLPLIGRIVFPAYLATVFGWGNGWFLTFLSLISWAVPSFTYEWILNKRGWYHPRELPLLGSAQKWQETHNPPREPT
jgi:hypothetical protein